MMRNKYAGSSFDSFLEAEGLEVEVAARAAKKTFIHQLEQKMVKTKTNKNAIRKALKSPTTTERLFSDNVGISLETMSRAASAVDCELEIRLISKGRKKAA